MGTVYRGTDTKLGLEGLARVEREARLFASLNPPEHRVHL